MRLKVSGHLTQHLLRRRILKINDRLFIENVFILFTVTNISDISDMAIFLVTGDMAIS